MQEVSENETEEDETVQEELADLQVGLKEAINDAADDENDEDEEDEEVEEEEEVDDNENEVTEKVIEPVQGSSYLTAVPLCYVAQP